MSDRKAEIWKSLQETRSALDSVLDKLTPEQWEQPVQDGDARWTTRQMLSHLFDSERGMTGQIVKIAAGQEAIPPDFDLNRWNRRIAEKMNDKTVAQLRESLVGTHLQLKTVLDGLTEPQLDIVGRHSSLQMLSVEQILRLISSHEQEHMVTIAGAFSLAIPR